jgi:hypothetical protein
MTVFLLGAGCSYGTLEKHPLCPPLAKGFGRCLVERATREKYSSLAKVACHLRRDLSELGLEEIWSCIDYYAKFGEKRDGFLPEPDWSLKEVVCELKRAILLLYGHGCDDASRAVKRTTNCTLVSLLKRVRGGDTIISFNYDTLVERSARKLKVRLRHGLGRVPRKEVRFAKPHGSISWRVRGLHPPLSGAPVLDTLEEQSVVCGCSDTEPLVLGAVPIKSELIKEVQWHYGACDVFALIMRQWQVVVDAIRDADIIVVLGYRFPDEDQYGRFLLKEGAGRRHKRLRKVE